MIGAMNLIGSQIDVRLEKLSKLKKASPRHGLSSSFKGKMCSEGFVDQTNSVYD